MHELSIAEELLRIIVENARQAGIGTVREVNLKVGELSGIVPEALEFAFEVLSKGGVTEGAKLTIERVRPIFICRRCRREVPESRTGNGSACEWCGEAEVQVRGGSELQLFSIEGE